MFLCKQITKAKSAMNKTLPVPSGCPGCSGEGNGHGRGGGSNSGRRAGGYFQATLIAASHCCLVY